MLEACRDVGAARCTRRRHRRDAVVEAVDRLAADGIKAHALAPRMLWPLPTHQIDPFLKGKKIVIVPEVNYTGQFAQILSQHYHDIEFKRLNVYGGQPFNVSQLVEAVKGAHVHA